MVFQKTIIVIFFVLIGHKAVSQNEAWINVSLTNSDYAFSNSHNNHVGLGIGIYLQHNFGQTSAISFGLDLKNIKYSLNTSDFISNSNTYVPIKYKQFIPFWNDNKIELSAGVNFLIQGKGEIGWTLGNQEYERIKYKGVFPLINFGIGDDFVINYKTRALYCKVVLSDNIGFKMTDEITVLNTNNGSLIKQKTYGNFIALSFSFRINKDY